MNQCSYNETSLITEKINYFAQCTSVDKHMETHIVDLELALVLFLQVSRQVIEHGSAAAPVGVKTWRASYLRHLQTCLLICGGDGNMLG